jgi:acetoin utilization deacetylase AcuC-like enzyme
LAQSHDSGAFTPLVLRYCDHHHFPLPEGHKFPLSKYRLLREQLSNDPRFKLQPSDMAPQQAVLQVHAQEYVHGFLTGSLDREMMRRIGFPWSPELVERTLASAGGTLGATCSALRTGFGGTLAGGTHHAFRERGSGFCVFNDIAIAIVWAREEAGVQRAAVVDLDVHQGDGTAAIFSGDPGVFTLSLHGARNFPFHKQTSSLDIELLDGTSDEDYLAALEPALQEVWQFSPELVIFQAGVDALESDLLGRLALTMDGLRRRDALVIGEAHLRGIPLVVTLGGGYADPLEETVRASAQTFLTAATIYGAESTPRVAFQPRSTPEP